MSESLLSEDARAESLFATDRAIRYQQITTILGTFRNGQTARLIAIEMHRRGYTPTDDPNFARPRLTEMVQACKVIESGKRMDEATKRRVTVYRLPKRGEVTTTPDGQGCFIL